MRRCGVVPAWILVSCMLLWAWGQEQVTSVQLALWDASRLPSDCSKHGGTVRANASVLPAVLAGCMESGTLGRVGPWCWSPVLAPWAGPRCWSFV